MSLQVGLQLASFWLLSCLPLVSSQCPAGYDETGHWCVWLRDTALSKVQANADCDRRSAGKLIDLETVEEWQALLSWLTAGKYWKRDKSP